MANLIPLDQAAAILGMTVEQITELRSNNEIFGYRDGASWKFKMTELERVAADLDISMNLNAVVAPSTPADLNLQDSSDDLLIDDSSAELIEEDSSVEIQSQKKSQVESVLDLGDSGELSLSSSDLDLDGSGLSLSDSGLSLTDSGLSISDSALNLQGDDEDSPAEESASAIDDEDLAFGSSSIRLAAESSKKLTGNDTGDLLDDVEEPSGSPSDTGKMLGASDGDDLLLSDDDLFADDMSLADSGSFEDSAELSSDFEDSDLIMEDSDSSTEIVLEANDSGINLSPNESGIALSDDSMEFGGSDIDSLELPEDDEDIVMLDEPADQDAATVMQEGDFNLTPLEEAVEGESSSQIIALEDSEIYADESSATILAESAELGGEPAMLDDAMGLEADPYGAVGLAPAGVAGVEATPEAPYTLYQIISLGAVTALLALGSMVAYDLARNMWMPEDQVLSSGVLKIFLGIVGMD